MTLALEAVVPSMRVNTTVARIALPRILRLPQENLQAQVIESKALAGILTNSDSSFRVFPFNSTR